MPATNSINFPSIGGNRVAFSIDSLGQLYQGITLWDPTFSYQAGVQSDGSMQVRLAGPDAQTQATQSGTLAVTNDSIERIERLLRGVLYALASLTDGFDPDEFDPSDD